VVAGLSVLGLLATVAGCGGAAGPRAAQPPPTVSGPSAGQDATPGATPGTGRAATPGAAGSAAVTLPASPPLRWRDCGGTAQCATLVVPLDYSGSDPAARGRTVGVAVIRYPATGPGSWLGDLVVNPGGPGGSGVAFLRSDLASLPAAVRARYDVVSFDPRGVGASDPVSCVDAAQLDALVHLPPVPTGPAEQAAVAAASRELAAGCQAHAGDLLAHLGTLDVARDLDRLRAALGQPRLTYLGYSYGTFLGATYAELYPGRVRAMVLDGAVDPAATGAQFVTDQAGGFELNLDDWFSWCAATTSCAFRDYGGATPTAASLGRAYQALVARIGARPLPVGNRSVGDGELLNGVLITFYSPATGFPDLGEELAQDEQDDASYTLALSDAYVGRNPDGSYQSMLAASLAISCVDRPWPHTLSAYAALAATLARRYPYLGAALGWSGVGCLDWPVPAASPGPDHAAGAAPILVIAATGDPATPYGEGVALARDLDSGVLLSVVGDGHTQFHVGGPSCVLALAERYLLTLRAPARATGARCG
jgi:pimeloyl-ACP methyl ester carboxylesterase